MACLLADGLNGEDITLYYDATNGTVASATTNPRTGASYCRMTAATGGTYIRKNLTFGSNTAIIGFALRNEAATTEDRTILTIREGSTVHVSLLLLGSGSSYVLRLTGPGGTLATGATTIPQGTNLSDWRYIELKVFVDNSAGTYELKINDAAEFSGSSADTSGTASPVISSVWLQNFTSTISNKQVNFTDFYVFDDTGGDSNTFSTSATKVYFLNATAAGDSAQFTPSAGSNYQNVDETTANDGDSTYNSSSTVGHADAFNCADLAVTPASIKAVQVCAIAKKTDVGACSLTLPVRSNGSDSTSEPERALTTSYVGYVGNIVTANPDGGGGWTKSAVDAAQAKYARAA